jgi:dATP pyrophosphohydrolase
MAGVVSRIIEICVFKLDSGIPKYLLLKRSDIDKIYPGIWQWITGSLKEGESALKAAVRELAEETGMKPTRLWVVPHVNSFYVVADDTVHLSPLFAAEVSADGQPKLSSEHQAFDWCLHERARHLLVWPGQRRGLEVVHEYITGEKEAARLTQVSL